MKNLIYILLLSCTVAWAQQVPGAPQKEIVTIVGATAHIGNGKVIENSVVVFENGIITAVADKLSTKMPYKGRIIKADGKHLYPGFIAPNSTLGLVEIDAVRASKDENEVGSYNPHIRSIIAYNTESRVTETMRPNGVLMGQIVPRGGRISGTSSVVQFDAWNWEDAILKENDGIHINWPRTFARRRWRRPSGPTQPNKEYPKHLAELQEFFNKAKAYNKANGINVVYEGMVDVLKGTKKVFMHVADERQIIDAVSFGLKNKLTIVLVGAYDAYKTIPLLKKHNIPVLLKRVHSTPEMDYHDYDLPYRLANLLSKEGILVGLESSGEMERMNTRNLPFYAGTCVGFGLDKEKAVQLISLNTAKILGIDDKVGSITVGKHATLFISNGDALDMRTNQLTHAFIQGRVVSLESHQTELYKRYTEKYKNQQ